MDSGRHLHWLDYVVVGLSLMLTLAIGVFFHLHDRRKYRNNSNEQFLMGGRSLHPFAVGLSLLATFLNAVFLIGVPAEVYYNGAIYAVIAVGMLATTIINTTLLIPMFRKMKITSAHEVRFGKMYVRVAASIVFIFSTILFLAVVLYAPALAFSQVTGVSVHVVQVVCGLICTVYVFLGGLKAVVWTDAIQMVIAVLGSLVIVVIGTQRVGGAAQVYSIAWQDNRLNFNVFSMDPRVRHTVWTQAVLTVFTYLPNCCNQMFVQRYMAVSTTRRAQAAMWINLAFLYVLLFLVVICGLVMYAYFRTCDPFMVDGFQRVTKRDQLFLLLLMELFGDYPGLPGLYTAAVFAAALSSVSSAVHSLAAVALEDFIRPLYTLYAPLTDTLALRISRGLTLVFGLLTIALSYMAPLLGDVIIQIPMTIWGVVGAPLFGMYVLGMFIPCANAVGAVSGLVVSLTFSFWWFISAVLYRTPHQPLQPIGTQCNITTAYNTTQHPVYGMEYITTEHPVQSTQYMTYPHHSNNTLQYLYDMSYTYYGLVNTVICVLVGLIVSLFVNRVRHNKADMTPSDVDSLVYDWSRCCRCQTRKCHRVDLPDDSKHCAFAEDTTIPMITSKSITTEAKSSP